MRIRSPHVQCICKVKKIFPMQRIYVLMYVAKIKIYISENLCGSTVNSELIMGDHCYPYILIV